MTLRVAELWFDYEGEPLLRGIDLELPPGQNAFLLGPSGSGKTTVLRCIAGLERPKAGRITWNDEDLGNVPPHRRGIGFLHQEPALFPHLRVLENVAFGLRYRGVPRAGRRDEALAWLARVRLAEKADARVDELSGGQRQRVALARTLAAGPRIVLLDEPLSALDRQLRDELGQEIKALLADAGVAALWVTHDRDEAAALGDVAWELRDGQARPWAP